jgi:hypothetical protein
MKIALYIEDGLEQIVLTPQSESERGILRKLHDGSRELKIHHGEFYHCQGGWTRHGFVTNDFAPKDNNSTIIVLREIKQEPQP